MAETMTPLVDSHLHIFKHGMPFTADSWARPDYEFTLEQCLAMLDRHGISFAVIAAASLFGTFNDYTRHAVRSHSRLRGTVIVDPDIDLDTLEAMKREGIVGIRLQWCTVKDLPDLSAPPYRTLLARLRDLDWHVELNLHGPRLPPVLRQLADSEVKVVIDHFGHPAAEGVNTPGFQAVLAAIGEGRTWVKLSGSHHFKKTVEEVAAYVDALVSANPQRLFWGSDCPFVGSEAEVNYDQVLDHYAQWLDHYAQWTDDTALRAQIDRNAVEFYFS